MTNQPSLPTAGQSNLHESDLGSESPLPHVFQALLPSNVATLGGNNGEGNEPFEATHEQIADPRRAFDVEPGGTLTADITALTAEGQQLARWALEVWTSVTGIHFEFLADEADITFDDAPADTASSRNVVEGNRILSSHVNIPVTFLETHGATPGSVAFQAHLQEVGHALGFGPAGPGRAGAPDSPGIRGSDNLFLNDSWQASVTFYPDQTENTGIDADYASPVTLMVEDILAGQALYGAPADSRDGDTVYGDNVNLGGHLDQPFAQWTDRFLDQPVTLTLYDVGGKYTPGLHRNTSAQWIDLRPEGTSDVYGVAGNLVIPRDTREGDSNANRLPGLGGDDQLWGRGGDDVLSGGPGGDRFIFHVNHGNDTILNFTNGEDLIDLGAFGLSGFDALALSSDSNGVMIDLTAHGGGTILLEGFDIADLDTTDFSF